MTKIKQAGVRLLARCKGFIQRGYRQEFCQLMQMK